MSEARRAVKNRPEWDCGDPSHRQGTPDCGDPSHHHRSTLHARECRRKSGREEAA
jgi:hypothetical protein